METGDLSEIFADLKEYNTIIAYKGDKACLPVFESKAGSRKVYLDLRTSEELEERFVKFYRVEKLPCMIKFGHNVYIDENTDLDLDKADKKEDVHYRNLFQYLVNSYRVFVFIKGRVRAPRCKFTRKLIGILEDKGLVYEKDFFDFDVLSDIVMREKLKVFNNWTTFPQIFIKGKFFGGLDTLMDIVDSSRFCDLFL